VTARRKPASSFPPALQALRRAAKKAVELGRKTQTPVYVERDGVIVDIGRKPTKKRRPASRRA
jgi:hypothetical protein